MMIKYRREIDGLRAVAVLAVIFFHAGFKVFSGGFVGVDVFFVISGYLITSIILIEKQKGNFTLGNFYERRIRRILPALFFVMGIYFVFAWFWMMPDSLKRLSQSFMYVSVFASNIFFWRTKGYFDPETELFPFFHTWSLAVEEQYYLFFPLFLLITWRFGKRWIVVILSVVAIISLAVTQWGSSNMPAATFYLLPTRGWELLVGSFIAFYCSSKKLTRNERELIAEESLVNQIAGFIGLFLIAYAVFVFDESIPFPSLYALVPTMGAALIILFATEQTYVGKMLGFKGAVGIGLVSYSAYLWHQPLFAFARLYWLEEPSVILSLQLIASTFALAYLTWKYIEAPFRNKDCINRKNLYVTLVSVSILVLAMGFFGWTKNGFIERFSEDEKRLLSFSNYDFKRAYRQGVCSLDLDQSYLNFGKGCVPASSNVGTSIFVWGDSHAAAMSSGFQNLVPSSLIQYTASACPPVAEVTFPSRPYCSDINDFVLEEIGRLHPMVVIMQANWRLHFLENSQIDMEENLLKTILKIKKISKYSLVYITGNVPQWLNPLPVILVRKKIDLNQISNVGVSLIAELRREDTRLKKIATASGATFISILDLLCKEGACQGVVPFRKRYEPLAWDGSHLTEAGAVWLVNKMLSKNDFYCSLSV